jgi:hypothetical protein
MEFFYKIHNASFYKTKITALAFKKNAHFFRKVAKISQTIASAPGIKLISPTIWQKYLKIDDFGSKSVFFVLSFVDNHSRS